MNTSLKRWILNWAFNKWYLELHVGRKADDQNHDLGKPSLGKPTTRGKRCRVRLGNKPKIKIHECQVKKKRNICNGK